MDEAQIEKLQWITFNISLLWRVVTILSASASIAWFVIESFMGGL
ncbi:hypothetical protein [Streptomyces griseosporeus]|nr:hypothetical protein [Streptomyces griseosporeus]